MGGGHERGSGAKAGKAAVKALVEVMKERECRGGRGWVEDE